MSTIFKKIIDREIPAKILYEDELCLAFHDISPKAPIHFLLIPKKEIQSLDHLTLEDEKTLGHMMVVISKLARELKFEKEGYRVVTNIGENGGQTVPHLHFHILAGRELSWPPG